MEDFKDFLLQITVDWTNMYFVQIPATLNDIFQSYMYISIDRTYSSRTTAKPQNHQHKYNAFMGKSRV
jgi:hypothetical protein